MSKKITINMLSEIIMTDPESLMTILKEAGKPVDSMDTPLTDEQKKALMSPKKTSITAKTTQPSSSSSKSDGIAVKIIRKEKTILTQSHQPPKETKKARKPEEKAKKPVSEPPQTPPKEVPEDQTKPADTPEPKTVSKIIIPETISIDDLAKKLHTPINSLLKSMLNIGFQATKTQIIDFDTACLLGSELFFECQLKQNKRTQKNNTASNVQVKPPVVTIMGHVDHGKTTLLDTIRKSSVTQSESGGITQHIGAYQITHNKKQITFIDTPGHAAFTAMRSRGCKITDIVILIVAADDSVKPQTIEALQHARNANVPIIVGISKIDKPGANLDKVRQDLSQHGVTSEEWGGQEIFAPFSAKSKEGIPELLESILLVAEMLELSAPTQGTSNGVVLESKMEKGKGAVTTLLIEQGELKSGQIVLAGQEYGKIKRMSDDLGKTIKSAKPGQPVEIIGLSKPVEAGDTFEVIESEKTARQMAEQRQAQQRDILLARKQSSFIENLLKGNPEDKKLNIIIKSDTNGSLGAICDTVKALSTETTSTNIVSSSVGSITESDVQLADTTNSIILGFNVRADKKCRDEADRLQIRINYFNIIYDLIDHIQKYLEGLDTPSIKENITGYALVKDVFRSSKFGTVSGCVVTEGFVKKNNKVRIIRDGVVIFEGEINSLRKFKDDVNEVTKGSECGIGIKNYKDIKVNDQIESFSLQNVTTE